MDCSWDYEGNSACDGGNYEGALDYLIDAGGAALDQDYEYLGQDGWCLDRNHTDTHTTNLTKFKVCTEVHILTVLIAFPCCWHVFLACLSTAAAAELLPLLSLQLHW